jgi:hypothetical protein
MSSLAFQPRKRRFKVSDPVLVAYLVEENRVLREQIGNRSLNFDDDQRRRMAVKAKKVGRKTLEQVATIAAAETLLTWHRNLIAGKQIVGPRRPRGRPATRPDIAALVIRMAEENRSWGYRRIQGALANLGHDLAHNTIRNNILQRHGVEPSPERVQKTTWKEFLQRHWEQIVASDFSSIDASERSRFVSLVMFWASVHLSQYLPRQFLRFGGQATSMLVGKSHSVFPDLFPENTIFPQPDIR